VESIILTVLTPLRFAIAPKVNSATFGEGNKIGCKISSNKKDDQTMSSWKLMITASAD
jgi:hypothetical protein